MVQFVFVFPKVLVFLFLTLSSGSHKDRNGKETRRLRISSWNVETCCNLERKRLIKDDKRLTTGRFLCSISATSLCVLWLLQFRRCCPLLIAAQTLLIFFHWIPYPQRHFSLIFCLLRFSPSCATFGLVVSDRPGIILRLSTCSQTAVAPTISLRGWGSFFFLIKIKCHSWQPI